jgi:hypothetical protein
MEFNSTNSAIFVWLMNLAALLVSIMPVLQFIALFLAIVVSITTIIINYQKFKKQ